VLQSKQEGEGGSDGVWEGDVAGVSSMEGLGRLLKAGKGAWSDGLGGSTPREPASGVKGAVMGCGRRLQSTKGGLWRGREDFRAWYGEESRREGSGGFLLSMVMVVKLVQGDREVMREKVPGRVGINWVVLWIANSRSTAVTNLFAKFCTLPVR
jgi:hypothetical protein